jgi:putative transposase
MPGHGCRCDSANIERFNGKLRDELLPRQVFDTLLEAKMLIERWRQAYNTIRPHSSLGYRAPAPEATQPCSFASATPPQTNRAGMLATPTLI